MDDERFEGMSQETLAWLMRRALGGGLAYLVAGAGMTWVGAKSMSAGKDIGVMALLVGLILVALGVMCLAIAARIRRRQQRQP